MANNGMDDVGSNYLKRTCEMCRELDLFGDDDDKGDPKMSKARTYTAWVVFSFQAMYNYFYFRPPIVEQPPQIALPDAKQQPQWYGDVWVRYPQSQTIYPLHLGHNLQAETAIHAIMNKMGLLAFGDSSKSLSLEDYVELKQALDAWKESLPEVLQSARLIFPPHFALQ